jgi:hypothetical protein
MRTRRTAVVGAWTLAIVAWVGAASSTPAFGSEDARLDLRRTEDVSWLDATVEAPVETVTIRVLAPDEEGGRFLYQRCRLAYSGSGEYSCGVEIGAFDRYPGQWVAKLRLDDEINDRLTFGSP